MSASPLRTSPMTREYFDRSDNVGVDVGIALEVDLGRERPAGGVTDLEVDVTGPDEVAPQGLQELGGRAAVGNRVGRGHDGLELEPSGGVGREAPAEIALGDRRVVVRVSPAALACHTSISAPARAEPSVERTVLENEALARLGLALGQHVGPLQQLASGT